MCDEDAAAPDVVASLSRTYCAMQLSIFPRYFFPTPMLPFLTSMHGLSFKRFAPMATSDEQRPPFCR